MKFATASRNFIVAKNDLAKTQTIEAPLPNVDRLRTGSLFVRIDRFAFTANNITYAKLGDAMKYWSLFPEPDGYGNIPVWGFGEVVASRHPDVSDGEKLFGYFPMATYLTIDAANVSKRGLRDATDHRQEAAAVYNAYARVTGNPDFSGRLGDYQALLRPLFMLSFLVDDHLAENACFGAQQVVLSSASSKTAFGLAHLLSSRDGGIKVVGLTSAKNADFVRSLGCYDDVILYDDIEKMDRGASTAFVDMAGSSSIRGHIHRHLGEKIVFSGRVGLTHDDQQDVQAEDLPGAKPEWFFAPDHIRQRAKAWGPGEIERRLGQAWAAFTPNLDRWIDVVESHGQTAVRDVYLATLKGDVAPRKAHMLSLHGSTPHLP